MFIRTPHRIANDCPKKARGSNLKEIENKYRNYKNEAKWSLHLVNCIFMTILSSYICTCTCIRHEVSTCHMYVTKWSSFQIPCHTIINIFVISIWYHPNVYYLLNFNMTRHLFRNSVIMSIFLFLSPKLQLHVRAHLYFNCLKAEYKM